MKTTDERKRKILEGFRNGLIVSCQVQKDDPIYTDDIVVKMAQAAKWAGAAGIRDIADNEKVARFGAENYRRITSYANYTS